MGNGSRAFLSGGLGFAVSFLVACGGSNGLLTGGEAGNLNDQLAAISSAVANGQCGAAADAALSFSNQVANLPTSVNTTLVQNLGQGAATVRQLAAKDCRSSSSTRSSSTSSSTSTPTSTSSSSSTSSTPTTTSSSSTTNTSSTSSTVTNPPSTSTSSTTSNGGVGVGGTGTAGNQNGQ